MKRVITLTMNPAIDMSCSVESVFPEHKLRCQGVTYEPGGGGINVSRAIRNLGGDTQAFFLAGGPAGATLEMLLDRERIPHRAISIEGWTRENLSASETATGQEYRFVLPGPTVNAREWNECLCVLAKLDPVPDLIVASGSLPPGVPDDFYGRIVRELAPKGARMILDTSGAALPATLRAGVYLAKPSMRELRCLAQRPLVHEDEQEEAAMEIILSGQAEALLVSLGAAGALFASIAGCERLRSPTIPVKSRVGAGDSMVAGVALSLARGLPLRDAVRFGVAAGAAAVMNPGTQLCHRDDSARLFQAMIGKEKQLQDPSIPQPTQRPYVESNLP